DHPRSRATCAEIAGQRIELARSVERERLEIRVAALERERSHLAQLGALADSDPQARILSQLFHGQIAIEDVGLGLVLVLVTMVELVSGFGPLVLSEFARSRNKNSPEKAPPTVHARVVDLQAIGDVFEFMAECVRPAPRDSIEVR